MGLWGIIVKEFRHIIRDSRTLIIIFVMPVLEMVMFGYAMNLEIQQVNLLIDDRDRSELSREFISTFRGSDFFELVYDEDNQLLPLFQKRKIMAHITIPDDFSRKIVQGRQAEVDIIIDGSNSNSAQLAEQYIISTAFNFYQKLKPQMAFPVVIEPMFKYNPQLESTYFFIPGLTSLLMIMITALLTSITIAKEKETGTFTLLKLSPLHSYEIIIGKVIPYIVLSMVVGVMIVGLGVTMFGVPVTGSWFTLLLYLFLYCLTGLSLGIMISTISPSQQVAMMLALFVTMLPTLFLSGFIFPVESMPKILQWMSTVIPAKYFLIIIRGIMLKGNSQADLISHILFLLFFTLFFLTVSIKKFTASMEK